jgi:hypothetical protein
MVREPVSLRKEVMKGHKGIDGFPIGRMSWIIEAQREIYVRHMNHLVGDLIRK